MIRQAPGTRADQRAFVAVSIRRRDNGAYDPMNSAVYIEIFDSALGFSQIAQGIKIHGEGGRCSWSRSDQAAATTPGRAIRMRTALKTPSCD